MTLQELLSGRERVPCHSELAIWGLRLEDVLGQLLDVTGLCAAGMSTLAAALAIDRDRLARNRSLQARLSNAVAKADQRARNRVIEQESLARGDVEFFERLGAALSLSRRRVGLLSSRPASLL